MQITQNGTQYASLQEYVEKNPQDAACAATLKANGLQILETARDRFARGTYEECDAAYHDLKDLEDAMRATVRGHYEASTLLSKAFTSEIAGMKGEPARTEVLENAPRLQVGSKLNGPAVIARGRREYGAEMFGGSASPNLDPMSGVVQFYTALNTVASKYAIAMAVSGPVGAAMATVPTQEAHSRSESSASSSAVRSMEVQRRVFRTTVSAAVAQGSTAQSSERADFESEPTGIKLATEVIGPLIGLQDRLKQIKSIPASHSVISSYRSMKEYETVDVADPIQPQRLRDKLRRLPAPQPTFHTEEKLLTQDSKGLLSITRGVATLPTESERIWVP